MLVDEPCICNRQGNGILKVVLSTQSVPEKPNLPRPSGSAPEALDQCLQATAVTVPPMNRTSADRLYCRSRIKSQQRRPVIDLNPVCQEMIEVLAGVTDHQLNSSSSCTEYTVGDLIGPR